MKKTGILLICMLSLTCCLFWVRERMNYAEEQNFSREENFLQEQNGAGGIYDTVEEKLLYREEDIEKEQELVRELEAECYDYSMLNEEERRLYREIWGALTNYRVNVRLSSCDKEEISRVFQCVMNDHPEIFYVEGYTYTEYTLGSALRKITFTGVYSMEQKEIADRQRKIDAYVEECLRDMPAQADEYEKVKYIYEYLICHTEYDSSVGDNQNICSVFLDRRSVCQGYAKAMQYLLRQVDVYATLVLGNVIHGESHAWDLVRIDGEFYYVDVTWGDASYQAVDQQTDARLPEINYDYLCVTTQQLEKTHRIDNVVAMPECTSMDANYYVREGVYFTQMDQDRLQSIFADAYDKGQTYITLKCADAEVYRQMRESLIERQEIFSYLQLTDEAVSYSENDKQYSMSFWL